ncbi:MAG: hypothetical protein M3M94_06525 [Actinomycetota bacterium]|nr:hypothetical protein [Actinomycetota bacterium]
MHTSTSHDRRPDPADAIVTLLSRWLAGHLGNAELRREVEALGTGGLDEEQREAVEELVAELDGAAPGERARLQVPVRETIEALALGG